jgi:hypothetical protein
MADSPLVIPPSPTMTEKQSFESPYLYGLHDAGGEHLMLEMNAPGWVLITEAIGFNPEDKRGKDYTHLTSHGLSVMVRLNAGYAGVGTIPYEKHYADFARRCAHFVDASPGAHVWIIGNEPNHPIEWPGADWDWGTAQPRTPDSMGEKITPGRYVKAYLLARDAIHDLPGHEDDLVLTAAVAPWNALCTYPGNPHGDWIVYFRQMLKLLGPDHCDGITLHAYTHGANPDLIDAESRMGDPYQRRRYEFRVYQDFMNAIPWEMQHLPVYLTEADENEPWRNENIGWVQRAYGEIDYWNKRHPFRPIRSLILYRWSQSDQWHIDGKQGVIEDFRQAIPSAYRWDAYQKKAPAHRATMRIMTAPEFGPAGETITASLAIRNIGRLTWKRSGRDSVRVGYHWRDKKGGIVQAPDFRTTLPHTVEPGEWVEVEAAVGLPSIPGKFTLVMDMVHEGVTWFEEQKSRPARRTIEVRLTGRGEALNAVWRYLQYLKEENQQLKRTYLGLEGPEPPPYGPIASLPLASTLSGDYLALGKAPEIPKPAMVEMVDELPRRQDKQYESRELSQITHITVHHSAAPASITPRRVAEYHVYSESHQWPGMGYHFYIGPDGTIYHTQDLKLISWHVYKNNSYTAGVCLAGNFTSTVPPAPQLQAAARLIAWLMQELRIPAEYVLGHKEFPLNATACPGFQWDNERRWKEMLMSAIEDVRSGKTRVTEKVIEHYALFWKHADDWAQEDWRGAAEYIARFDAAAGFSEEVARLARLVTIVGGLAGVDVGTEARLRDAGCIVQRVAGKTTKETAALLQRMASEGRKMI